MPDFPGPPVLRPVPSVDSPAPLVGHLGPMRPEDFDSILEMDWLVEGWFETDDLVIWAGDPGIGKSVLCLAAAVSLASGQPILGCWPHPTGKPFKVAILDLENRSRVIQRRLIRICRGLGVDLNSIYPEHLDIFPLRGVGIFGKDDTSEEITSKVFSDLRKFTPQLVVLDTLMSATNQEDLSPLSGVRFIRDFVMRWSNKLGCGWWLIHHNKKISVSERPEIGDQNQASGGGFVGMCDALVMLQRNGRNVILTNPKQRHQSNPNEYSLTLDDGGHSSAPLVLSLNQREDARGPGRPPAPVDRMRLLLTPKLPLPRPEIVAFLTSEFHIAPRTAYAYIEEWIQEKWLVEVGSTSSSGGRAPTLIALLADQT